MIEVCKAIGRPPSYPIRYFGQELGVQTQIKSERFIVNGFHDALKLQTLLDSFIKKFVLCPICKNPETGLKVVETLLKRQSYHVRQTCKACGYRGQLQDRHKFIKYIISERPARVTKKRRYKIENFKQSTNLNDLADDVDWGEDVSPEGVQRRLEDLFALITFVKFTK